MKRFGFYLVFYFSGVYSSGELEDKRLGKKRNSGVIWNKWGYFLYELLEGFYEDCKEDLEIIVYNAVGHRNSFLSSFISTLFTIKTQDNLIIYSQPRPIFPLLRWQWCRDWASDRIAFCSHRHSHNWKVARSSFIHVHRQTLWLPSLKRT